MGGLRICNVDHTLAGQPAEKPGPGQTSWWVIGPWCWPGRNEKKATEGYDIQEESCEVAGSKRQRHVGVIADPQTRFYGTLIRGPVLVIDALNDADTSEIPLILHTQIQQQTGLFRVFVTSRPDHAILHALGPNIKRHTLAIHGDENHRDITVFLDFRLKQIAGYRCIDNWPDAETFGRLLQRAEGLFVWISTVCDYIASRISPDEDLEQLLDDMRHGQLPPEEKIDSLYAVIMAKCDWDDIHFTSGYTTYMGLLVVQQTPLTIAILGRFSATKRTAQQILLQVGSLVTGLMNAEQPAQILHGSYRDYLGRAPDPQQIAPEVHHQCLALHCMEFAAATLSPSRMAECEYSENWNPDGAPPPTVPEFFEEIHRYAVNFWMVHLTEILYWDPTLEGTVLNFLDNKLTHWIEFMVSKLTYQSLIPLHKWTQNTASGPASSTHFWNQPIECLLRILPRLIQNNRLGEGLAIVADLEYFTTTLAQAAADEVGDGEVEDDT
ncbi:hypothetical protein FB45DRAFT_1060899 [Roridomyces roridus]|uniref:Uncharacterized protein n=1 Tax=Roridomyces roridus TaxID=1738132 RepID=A0AAD7BLI9_9AGAR|nr:hypothetical protein FB45DRAFT_1060899 [Roridomyces roridus]